MYSSTVFKSQCLLFPNALTRHRFFSFVVCFSPSFRLPLQRRSMTGTTFGPGLLESKRRKENIRGSSPPIPPSSSTQRDPFSRLSGQRGDYLSIFVVYSSYAVPQWDNPCVKAGREKKTNQGTYPHGSFSSSLLLFPICYYV